MALANVFFKRQAIEAFKEKYIDKVILEKMINDESNMVYKCRFPSSVSSGPSHESEKTLANFNTNFIYTLGKPCDYFILIIEGKMVVEAGQEKTECYAKEFSYFGVQALLGKPELSPPEASLWSNELC